jgi:dipeptidase E
MRKLLLVSSSRCHPFGYLEHCETELRRLFADVSEVLFVPYARPDGASHDEYTEVARSRFHEMGFALRGVHQFADPRDVISKAQGVFVGGGNTFVLLRDLYAADLLEPLRNRIASGMPYMGTSAGSNIAGQTIGTSNDMPIVYPPDFAALGIVPFNLNPHFPKSKPDPTHRGETRETRISEFHCYNELPVVALYEDSMIRIEGDNISLVGDSDAIVFRPNEPAERIPPGLLRI